MAAMLSHFQVAGSHVAVYEAFYQQVDPSGVGTVGALEAAKFLKKSGLSDVILRKIWDLSDPGGQGYLDKQGLFVALKLVALAQNSKDINISNLNLDISPPRMGEPIVNAVPAGGSGWSMKRSDRAKYDQLFESLGPQQGKLPSTKVKPVMLNSKLPVDVLGRVWELSDVDKDGALDLDEFALAMHLIYKALENHPVPTVLPLELVPASKQKKVLPGAVPVLPTFPLGLDGPTRLGHVQPPLPPPPGSVNAIPPELTTKNSQAPPALPPPPSGNSVSWIITPADKAKHDVMFKNADLDGDGFVNGMEIKDIFLQSGLAQAVLAHIWNLCDVKQSGRLNAEQFSLAMHLVQQKLAGIEPPSTLAPEMIPPSMRPPKTSFDATSTTDNVGLPTTNTYGNSELELISKEIEELTKEKRQLEQDITQKEADIRIKNGEIKLLSSELATLTATLKQLESQKGEAQKRLDDLDCQKTSLVKSVGDLHKQVEEEKEKVSSLRKHVQEQELSVKEQEVELGSKRQELNELRTEEKNLEQQIQSGKNQLDQLNKTLQETLLQISQAKAKITHLQENQRQLTDCVTQYDSAISSGDVSAISDSMLKLTVSYIEPEYSKLDSTGVSSSSPGGSSVGGFSLGGSAFDDDPFKTKDPFVNANGFTADPFSGQDPFHDESFKVTDNFAGPADAFGGSDPFKDAFGANDAFKDADPFASGFASDSAPVKTDPFDPFGDGGFGAKPAVGTAVNGDLFGSDPFGAPAVAPRSESPTPALPPKKSKQPPPRPAPPRGTGVKTPRAAPPAPCPDPFSDQGSHPTGSTAHRGSLTGNNPTAAADPFASAFDSDPFDPFKDPSGATAVVTSNATVAAGADGFANFADFDSKFSEQRAMTEEDQLVWATQESVRAERDRQTRAARKEQADLELALALSKAEISHSPT